MSLSKGRLRSVVERLRTRPGHEMVRTLVHELYVGGLGIDEGEVSFEVRIPEVRGRLDAVFGATVLEFKRDLRREQRDAERQLARYLAQRERAERQRYVGIATDGAQFVAYQLKKGKLTRLGEIDASADDPRALLGWLDTTVCIREDLAPDPAAIRAEFGRDSLVFQRSMLALTELWGQAQAIPEAALKRALWGQHLEIVYGKLIEPKELFLQHTYLSIVAKSITYRLFDMTPTEARDLLDGTSFFRVGLNGAVETDFFDWPLLNDSGPDLVERIYHQIRRYRLSETEVDVLKSLYESLIDPRQRHYLGEYYTPDWLASWMCDEAISRPLKTRVLDPACGSGTFLFHCVRRYLDAAEQHDIPLKNALRACTEHVTGIDVHPVAVLFSRVTYLLAIGPARLRKREGELDCPVYLGDSLQWNVRPLLTEEEVEIAVPGEPPLRFPGSVAGDPTLLDRALRSMRQLADMNAAPGAFSNWMKSNTNVSETDCKILVESYGRMRKLHQEGRNHIWTYIVRNLTRPLWLSIRKGKPDVVIGNPPWLRFNAMSPDMQARFKGAAQAMGLWVGGKVATQQDLSAYFFARSVERYLKYDGGIAFVMPLASLSRAQYEGFRTRRFGDEHRVAAVVSFDKVWTFSSAVKPLFRVPACVIFGHKVTAAGSLPKHVTAYRGVLPRRDATPREARRALESVEEIWPDAVTFRAGSPYRSLFKQGATIVPRRLTLVELVAPGVLGQNRNVPFVVSRTGSLDKEPWKSLQALEGQIEKEFLRPLYLGESIAPFRVLQPSLAVIPWSELKERLLDSKSALRAGHMHLADWLGRAEHLWDNFGAGKMSLLNRLDYHKGLEIQFPIRQTRIVYAKAGNWPAAAVVEDESAVIDHKLYWMPIETRSEGRYLCAILNSQEVHERIVDLQSEGEFGPRDFDKVVFNLPIPRFRKKDPLHSALEAAAERAMHVAAAVRLDKEVHFQAARRTIREALFKDGISSRINELVAELLSD